ncbi:MAG: N-glycosylase/DNA lyase [Candidatus Omnitrophota bacterium]|nr:N-glycosylase/DNA lyase [Candidatus Omnitrophota bacterium]
MKRLPPSVKDLVSEYKNRKSEIKRRLEDFRAVQDAGDEEIFQELCFCILTANANALHCDKAIRQLKENGLLLKGSACEIKPALKGRVRFHNKKAVFITAARKLFKRGGKIAIKGMLDFKDIFKLREWLVDNIKGYGYKEASHFLRNIGLGRDIAILDRHILKNLKTYGVISKIPSSVGSRKIYTDIENKMREFSKKTRVPLDEMDLLFWSIETGFVFK